MLRRVSGRSMLPTLRDGQLVFAVKRKEYHVGAIVIAQTPDREVIKRVSEVKLPKVLLASDNTEEGATYTVQVGDILGKVIWPLQK